MADIKNVRVGVNPPISLYNGLVPKEANGKYDIKKNPWEKEIWDVYTENKLVYHKDKTAATLLREYNLIENIVDTGYGHDFYSYKTGRQLEESEGARIPLTVEQEELRPNLYYSTDGSKTGAILGKFLKLGSTLPNNDYSNAIIENVKKYTKKYPAKSSIEWLLGSYNQWPTGYWDAAIDAVGNRSKDKEPIEITIDNDGLLFSNNSAAFAFACAKINVILTIKNGTLSNLQGMFKGAHGVSDIQRATQYPATYTPVILKVILPKGNPDGNAGDEKTRPMYGLVPSTVADCFKWAHLNQRSYDEFFTNIDWRHCRDFSNLFNDHTTARINKETDHGYLPKQIGKILNSDDELYGYNIIRVPKGHAPYSTDVSCVWVPNQGPWEEEKRSWSRERNFQFGSIIRLCAGSTVGEIQCPIDCTHLRPEDITDAFYTPDASVDFDMWKGKRSKIKEVRLLNLGNMDFDFSHKSNGWDCANTARWVMDELSDASVLYMLQNMRDHSKFVAGKEDKLYMLGNRHSIRIPKEWERLLTIDLINSLTAKNWDIFVGNDTKKLQDYIVCGEEDSRENYKFIAIN